MANLIEYIVNLNGNAEAKTQSLTNGVKSLGNEVKSTSSLFDKMSKISFGISNIVGVVQGAVGYMQQFTDANRAQVEVETQLSQVMRNTMSATDEQIQSIKDLTAAQQALGVVGDEVQLSGAQELGTYLGQTDSLEKLIPVMNDMIAQQYGFNATQESAVGIATMMGKVMEGQTSALSRYGYSFTEAQEKILKYGTEEEKAATLAAVIEESVGGVNEALAATPEGRMKQLSNNFGDVKEQIGAVLTDLGGALAPTLLDIVSTMSDAINYVRPFVDEMLPPIMNGLQYIKDSVLMPLFNTLSTSFRGVIGNIKDNVSGLLDYTTTLRSVFEEHILPVVQQLLSAFMNIFGGMIDFVANSEILKDLFAFVGKIISGIYDAIGVLVTTVTWLWDNIVLPIFNAIESVYKKFKKGDKAIEVEAVVAPEIGTNQALEAAVATQKTSGQSAATSTTASSTAEAVATGGSRNTEIHISIEDMIKTVNFNGTTSENRQEIERNFAECLYRVLGMAQVSVG